MFGSGLNAVPVWLFLLEAALEVSVVLLFIFNRRRFKEFFKTGVIIAIAGLILYAPFQVLVAFQMDLKPLLDMFKLPGMPDVTSTPEYFSLLRNVMAVANVVQAGIYFSLVALAFVAASGEWERVRPRPFPLLMRTGEKVWWKNLVAAGIGVAGAIVSLVLARLLHVGPSGFSMELFPEAAPSLVPPGVEFALSLGFVTGAAVAEEIIFRGALLGFLVRRSKERTVMLLASIFSVSLAWAFMHFPNTDSPSFKIAQVFVLGVILAEVARRWSLESAVVLHVSFNAAALVIAYLPLG
jgi:membrane protease YdiL (CAAX protease family)